jgi:DNA-binding response OmpR family regulator
MNQHSRAKNPNPAPAGGMGKHTVSPGTILVVEDERIVARDLQQRLKRLGFAVPEVACSGEEALRIAELLRPQLILMDIKLRGKVDGLEAARQIGERLKIPVIFLSAYDDEETKSASRLLNAVDYLNKPFEDQQLYAAINDFFSRTQGTRKL